MGPIPTLIDQEKTNQGGARRQCREWEEGIIGSRQYQGPVQRLIGPKHRERTEHQADKAGHGLIVGPLKKAGEKSRESEDSHGDSP